MANIAISCLVDDSPAFLMQAWNWICSLSHLHTAERADIYVHHIAGIEPGRLRVFEQLGARLVAVEPFGQGPARYCNKIRQLENPDLNGYGHVILCDTDLVFLECPTELAIGRAIRGKPVDVSNPPEELWRQMFDEARLGLAIDTQDLELVPGARTFATNFNGGLYIVPGEQVPQLAESWAKWARFCLARTDLLGKSAVHADQMGFGMAVIECEIPFEYLPLAANFPLHQRQRLSLIESRRLTGVHYHREMDNHGLINRIGVPWIDAQVAELNRRLAAVRRTHFDNRTFWDFRYSKNPELGSGVGSRGQTLLDKRAMLLPHLRAAHGSVLDVGCGDLETMRYMPVIDYHGIDLSAEAIATAQQKRPDWRFDSTTVDRLPARSYGLVTCLDVLLHQSDTAEAEALVEDLVRVAQDAVIVSGYSQPVTEIGIVFYGRPLDEMLRDIPAVSRVEKIGTYRDIDLFLAVKHKVPSVNRHDIAPPELALGMMQTPDWRLLQELISLSRDQLGFFPSTIIRTMEYPWFATRLNAYAGDTVLDVGAGVSVLPLWLARKGCQIVTVDNHPLIRDPIDKSRWNEWGFLDYTAFDRRITSLNVDAATYQPQEPFGAIYSISVLEHVPAELRRRILANIKRQLAPRGRLYLSFDLIPGTDDLWLLSEGKAVEQAEVHGRLGDVLTELRDTGFSVVETTVRRAIPGSLTDVALVEASHA